MPLSIKVAYSFQSLRSKGFVKGFVVPNPHQRGIIYHQSFNDKMFAKNNATKVHNLKLVELLISGDRIPGFYDAFAEKCSLPLENVGSRCYEKFCNGAISKTVNYFATKSRK